MSQLHNILYKDGSIFQYASSLAATWVWAPALYVASAVGYYYGLLGLSIFLVPNVLGLIVFGYFASKARKKQYEGYSFHDAIGAASNKQQMLHLIISVTILVCSSFVQIYGMHLLLTQWFAVDKAVSALLISLVSLLVVWKTGIKGSIISDSWKYIVTLAAGIILLGTTLGNPDVSLSAVKIFDPADFDYLIGFGITTFIGLITAPYIDQTFWQRAYCITNVKDVFKTFLASAIMFGLVPLSFGLIGALSATATVIPGWEVSAAFTGIDGIILAAAVFCALLSTLDSNLCAIESLWVKNFGESVDSRWSYIILLVIVGLLFVYTNITLVQLFLIYGTIRTCMCVPTILIINNKFDDNRLFVGSVLAIVFGAIGFLIASILALPYAYVCTILALTLPLIGYCNNTTSFGHAVKFMP